LSKQQEKKEKSSLQSDLAISVEFNRIMHAMKAPIATGNEGQIKDLVIRAIQCLSRRPDDEIKPLDRISQKLRDLGIDHNVAKYVQPESLAHTNNDEVEAKDEAKSGYQVGKKRFALSTKVIGRIEELHQRVRTVEEAIVDIYNECRLEGMDILLIRELVNELLGMYSTRTIRRTLPDELKQEQKPSPTRRISLANVDKMSTIDDNNPLEDSEDHRSEAQITTEVSKSLYVNRPEDPEVEQALEERPVKDRMYIERLEKESQYRLEELNKKQEQIQVLTSKVEGYEDALTKFQSASDPKLQTSKPGKIWMYPFDWILEIQYAAAYKQGLQIDHDGSKVTNVTRITGLERR